MQILEEFSKTKILVIGDVMLDRYWWGSVDRISPEAPVPVVRLVDTTLAAGGAANVAVNIAGLGAQPILLGVVGTDEEAGMVKKVLNSLGVDSAHLVEASSRRTTVKTRVIAHSQQVARIDQETDFYLDKTTEKILSAKLVGLIPAIDAIVVSDYAKGLLTDTLLAHIISIAAAARKSVLVDPKGKDYAKYRGATIITPNRREAAEACSLAENADNMVNKAGTKLMDDHLIDAALITQGEAGMTLFQKGRAPKHFPAAARLVYDVTGAGDTVIATLATSLGAGADLETATMLANIAAGFVVEQVGTSSISLPELRLAISEL
ncbi:MAG: D-glycero-beta-D-manno-heptose-7-phosphate kinase [Pyrinomonadaceae bacterium]